MAFVQIIEFRTSDIERARQINDEWWRATSPVTLSSVRGVTWSGSKAIA
jgi:hypothetical protein